MAQYLPLAESQPELLLLTVLMQLQPKDDASTRLLAALQRRHFEDLRAAFLGAPGGFLQRADHYSPE